MKLVIHFVIRFFSFIPLVFIILSLLEKSLKSNLAKIAIIAYVIWLFYLIIEIVILYKKKQKNFILNNVILILSYPLLCFIFYLWLITPEYSFSAKSPDGNYELRVYSQKKLFSAPGDGGTNCAKLKLYNSKGQKLRESCESCPVFTRDISVIWEMKKKYVSFTKGGILEFSKGKCK